MNSNEGKQKFFLIYQITNLLNGRIYVGAHVTYNVNDKYMGSSKYLKKDIKEFGRENFKKDILHVFDNMQEMIKKEAEIVNREFCHRIDTYNILIGGITEFSWMGTISVKDSYGNKMRVYNDDSRYLSGELISITKGMVTVKDKEGNTMKVYCDDPCYLSGELIFFHTGSKRINPQKHSEETKNKISENNGAKLSQEEVSDIRNKIMNSNIDFSKYGWVNKVAVLIGRKPQKINYIMKKHLFEFYNERCFKRSNQLS